MLHSARWLAILFLVTCQCFGQDAQPLAFHTVDGVDQPLFEMKSRVNAMTVSPDGRFLAVAAESGELAIWDLELGEMHERKAFSEGPLNAVAFHPDDNIVVFAGGSSAIEVWDLEQDFRKTLDGSEAGTSAVAFFGVGIAAGGADGTIRFFHPNVANVVIGKEKHKGKIVFLSSSSTHGTKALPNGAMVVASVDDSGIMRLWNDGYCMLRKKSGGKDIRFAQFVSKRPATLFLAAGTPCRGRWLSIGLKDQYETYRKPIPVYEKRLVSVPGSTKPRTVLKQKTVCAKRYARTLPVLKETPAGTGYSLGDSLALSPDGTRIASANSNSIEVWDLHSDSARPTNRVIADLDEPINTMIWAADSNRLFTANSDGAIRVVAAF